MAVIGPVYTHKIYPRFAQFTHTKYTPGLHTPFYTPNIPRFTHTKYTQVYTHQMYPGLQTPNIPRFTSTKCTQVYKHQIYPGLRTPNIPRFTHTKYTQVYTHQMYPRFTHSKYTKILHTTYITKVYKHQMYPGLHTPNIPPGLDSIHQIYPCLHTPNIPKEYTQHIYPRFTNTPGLQTPQFYKHQIYQNKKCQSVSTCISILDFCSGTEIWLILWQRKYNYSVNICFALLDSNYLFWIFGRTPFDHQMPSFYNHCFLTIYSCKLYAETWPVKAGLIWLLQFIPINYKQALAFLEIV